MSKKLIAETWECRDCKDSSPCVLTAIATSKPTECPFCVGSFMYDGGKGWGSPKDVNRITVKK